MLGIFSGEGTYDLSPSQPFKGRAEMLSASAKLVADSVVPPSDGTRGIAGSDSRYDSNRTNNYRNGNDSNDVYNYRSNYRDNNTRSDNNYNNYGRNNYNNYNSNNYYNYNNSRPRYSPQPINQLDYAPPPAPPPTPQEIFVTELMVLHQKGDRNKDGVLTYDEFAELRRNSSAAKITASTIEPKTSTMEIVEKHFNTISDMQDDDWFDDEGITVDDIRLAGSLRDARFINYTNYGARNSEAEVNIAGGIGIALGTAAQITCWVISPELGYASSLAGGMITPILLHSGNHHLATGIAAGLIAWGPAIGVTTAELAGVAHEYGWEYFTKPKIESLYADISATDPAAT